jgi:hypothetical protein
MHYEIVLVCVLQLRISKDRQCLASAMDAIRSTIGTGAGPPLAPGEPTNTGGLAELPDLFQQEPDEVARATPYVSYTCAVT